MFQGWPFGWHSLSHPIRCRGCPQPPGAGRLRSLECAGFALGWPFFSGNTGSGVFRACLGFSSYGPRAGVAPGHVGSSRTRDRTHIPHTGRQILHHWTTREVPDCSFLEHFISLNLAGNAYKIYLRPEALENGTIFKHSHYAEEHYKIFGKTKIAGARWSFHFM